MTIRSTRLLQVHLPPRARPRLRRLLPVRLYQVQVLPVLQLPVLQLRFQQVLQVLQQRLHLKGAKWLTLRNVLRVQTKTLRTT